MQNQPIILILILLLALLLSYLFLNKTETGLEKLGNLTICDKYHDKTACSK